MVHAGARQESLWGSGPEPQRLPPGCVSGSVTGVGGGLAPDAAASTGARPRRSVSLRAESGTVTGTAAPVLHLDSETSPLMQGQGAEP